MTTPTTAGRPPANYDGLSIAMHWLVFLLVVGLFASAQYAATLTGAERGMVMGWHKAIGVVVGVLVLLRIVWRLVKGTPEPVEMTPALALLAKAAHGLLYVLLIVMPVSGMLASQFRGLGVPLLGIPALLEKAPELAKSFATIHGMAMKGIIALVLLHAAAAIWHHYVRHDSTLIRMAPWLRGRA